MSIISEIDRIIAARNNIVSAIEDKGVAVPSDSCIDDLPGLIQKISTSSGSTLETVTIKVTYGYLEAYGWLPAFLSYMKVKNGVATPTEEWVTFDTDSTTSYTLSNVLKGSYVQIVTFAGDGMYDYELETTDNVIKNDTDYLSDKMKTKFQNMSDTYPDDAADSVGTLDEIINEPWWSLSLYACEDCTVKPIDGNMQTPLSITKNGTYDVTNYATAIVNVPSSGATLETCSMTIVFDAGLAGNRFKIYATRFIDGKITPYSFSEDDDVYILGQLTIDNILCNTAITFLSDVGDAIAADEGGFTIEYNEYDDNLGCSILRLIAPSSSCTDTVTLDY